MSNTEQRREDRKEAYNWLIVVVVALLVLALLAFGARGLGLVSFKLFGAAEEDTRREVFKNSQAFQDGVISEIRNMQMSYASSADPDHKALLRSEMIRRADTVPHDAMPPDLASFVLNLRN